MPSSLVLEVLNELYMRPKVPLPLEGARPIFLGDDRGIPKDELAVAEELGRVGAVYESCPAGLSSSESADGRGIVKGTGSSS